MATADVTPITPKQREFIDVARREFVDRGYGAASIRAIAQRAGVSLSALYYHYPSKQELLAAAMNSALDSFFAVSAEELDRAEHSPAGRLCAIVAGVVRFRTTHQEESLLVQTEVRNLEPDNLRPYAERRDTTNTALGEVIAEGVAAGAFATPYPDDARRSILALCNAIAYWYDPAGSETVAEIIERYQYLSLLVVEHRGSE
ncbi:MAG TPA: TetR/AcrR family transcriptional regulator [Aldersonia sp.]